MTYLRRRSTPSDEAFAKLILLAMKNPEAVAKAGIAVGGTIVFASIVGAILKSIFE